MKHSMAHGIPGFHVFADKIEDHVEIKQLVMMLIFFWESRRDIQLIAFQVKISRKITADGVIVLNRLQRD